MSISPQQQAIMASSYRSSQFSEAFEVQASEASCPDALAYILFRMLSGRLRVEVFHPTLRERRPVYAGN